ncbi:hypothetical protein ACFLSE_08795 [Bacteroidota bacterium]
MKRIAIVFVFIFAALASFGQEPKKVGKKSTDPPKKEVVKTVPKSNQKQAQIKKAQIKKAQIQNRKKQQVVRKARAIRRKRNG